MTSELLDPFMMHLGLQAEIPAPGQARVWTVLKQEYLNSCSSAHGGFLYSLADAAFAIASNSHGIQAVALSTHMEYFQPVRVGDSVEAVASELHLGRRTASYRVEVRCGATLVAQFTGTVYRQPKQKSWLAGVE
jgi:acyl-CoA thioesterase